MDTIDAAKDTLKCVWKCIRCSNWPAENTHKPHTQWSMCWWNFQLCSYIFCTHSTCLTRQHYQRARLEKKIFIYKLRQRKSKGVEIQTTSIKILKIENAYHWTAWTVSWWGWDLLNSQLMLCALTTPLLS